MEPMEQIKAKLAENPVVLFMKGSPDFTQCGFSMKTVQALKECDVEFGFVDVLAQPEMRQNLPQPPKNDLRTSGSASNSLPVPEYPFRPCTKT